MSDPYTSTGADGAPNVAIDVQPGGLDGVFTVDASDLDDTYDLLAWGDTGWTNIVCDVTRVRSRRGVTRQQGVLTRAEALSLTIDVLDRDRRFDPLINADAIHAGTPIRLRAWAGHDPAAPEWSVVLCTGEVDDVPVQYVHDGDPLVTINAGDVIAALAGYRSTGYPEGVGAGDSLLGRVVRVLGAAGLTDRLAPLADLDATYATSHPATTLEQGWGAIVDAADAELGRVWADRDNRLVVRARGSALTGPIRGTLSDWHGEAPTEPHCCYADLAAALGTELLNNRTIGARRNGPGDTSTPILVQRDDTGSQARYRLRMNGGEQRSLDLQSDGQVVAWCDQVLSLTSRPELRIDTVQPAPWGADGAAWLAVLSTDIGDRWILRYHPERGPEVSMTVGVLGIDLDVSPTGWAITWTLTPSVDATGMVTLDESDLDSGDLLGPSSWAVPALAPAA